jgi:hypothetical protein
MPPQPDFRDMTEKDLRSGISELNQLIKELKRIHKDESRRVTVATGASVLSAVLLTAVFPPGGILIATTSAVVNIDPTLRTILARQALDNAEELRAKFKTVYRARPGRAFHDVAARAAREKQRRKAGRKFHFPGFGGG